MGEAIRFAVALSFNGSEAFPAGGIVDVAVWPHSLGMERYEQAFRENAVDEHVLRSLTAGDLKEPGVASIGHRRKLLDALDELRTQTQTQTRAPIQPPAQTRPAHATPGLGDAKAERRQVAVLFADLCGFAEMSGEIDPEEVLAMLDRYFEQTDRIVEQHGGPIDKHVGDCVMAVFGAPLSHGNDIERALCAALASRDTREKRGPRCCPGRQCSGASNWSVQSLAP